MSPTLTHAKVDDEASMQAGPSYPDPAWIK